MCGQKYNSGAGKGKTTGGNTNTTNNGQFTLLGGGPQDAGGAQVHLPLSPGTNTRRAVPPPPPGSGAGATDSTSVFCPTCGAPSAKGRVGFCTGCGAPLAA